MVKRRRKQETSPPVATPDRVVSISGEFQPDVITQEEMQLARTNFEILWSASHRAQRIALEIAGRIDNGAAVEPGKWAFCPSMHWVCLPREVQIERKLQRPR
jgi:hypothetical protein